MTMTPFVVILFGQRFNFNTKLRGSLFFCSKKHSEPLIYKEKI
ncbi:hypothetical protein CNEO4_380061 [Clostridium neonatale]|nr:hypothetical protein CNEO4_360036 [Clostridium neonatale]CAI3666332.1 hypothetical protein CNEO4_380061 [Clostridium neonatale]